MEKTRNGRRRRSEPLVECDGNDGEMEETGRSMWSVTEKTRKQE
jgi:hypothetical protein